jgi:disulfide bond formation protein DsbB
MKNPQKLQGIVAYFIFLQAFIAMLGSLYFSTFGDPVRNLLMRNFFPLDGGFPPCELCWFARILMYPITILSLIGMIKEDRRFTDYVLPLSLLGMCLDFFHYGLQKWNFPNPFRCTASVPCSAMQVQYFGFVTIPFLALTAFTVITILCLVNMWLNRQIAKNSKSTE